MERGKPTNGRDNIEAELSVTREIKKPKVNAPLTIYITSLGMWVIRRILLGSQLWKTHIQSISHTHNYTLSL